RNEGVPAEKIHVIPYAFDPTPYRADRRDARNRLRAGWSVGSKILLGTISRLFWVKDLPLLLKSFAVAEHIFPEMMLVIVGAGPEKEKLINLTSTLKISKKVIFTGYRTDLPDVYAAFDVYVHSALAEAGCQVVTEALASGKPVVSTRVGMNPEVLIDGITGYSAEPGDQEAFTHALLDMLRNRDQWGNMGKEGRKRVQRYDPRNIVPITESLYAKWLEQEKT
ncbi:MAG: glycosyltransferase family 4 protein, partial [Planctomycetota bacterium]